MKGTAFLKNTGMLCPFFRSKFGKTSVDSDWQHDFRDALEDVVESSDQPFLVAHRIVEHAKSWLTNQRTAEAQTVIALCWRVWEDRSKGQFANLLQEQAHTAIGRAIGLIIEDHAKCLQECGS